MKSKGYITFEKGDWVRIEPLNLQYRPSIHSKLQGKVTFVEITEVVRKLDGGTFYDCQDLKDNNWRYRISEFNLAYELTKVPKGNVRTLEVLYGK